MKRFFCLFLSLCLLPLFSACTPEPTAEGALCIVDDLGYTVRLNPTQKAACLLASFADLFCLSGGEVIAVDESAWEDFEHVVSEDTVNLGAMHHPSAERLLAAAPGLVLASAKIDAHVKLRDTLVSAGIPVIYLDLNDFDSYLRALSICTTITGRADLFEHYGTAQEKEISALLADASQEKPVTVLVLRASATSIRAKNSKDSVLSAMLADFPTRNIADSDSSLLEELNIESILAEDPDYVFFVQTGSTMEQTKQCVETLFSEMPLWNSLSAVCNGNVYFMENELYNQKPNARYAEAYARLSEILYEKA